MEKRIYWSQRNIFTFICFFCAFVLLTSGCATFRKKFIRQKKKDANINQGDLPILEPVDYPEKVYSPLDMYKQHYSLWKVWDRDFIQAVESNSSDKRQIYLLEQAVGQLEEMKKALTDEKQAEFAILIDELRSVGKIYEKPFATRNRFSIIKKVERHASKIRNQFAPDPALVRADL